MAWRTLTALFISWGCLSRFGKTSGETVIVAHEGEAVTLPCSTPQDSYTWYINSASEPSNRVVTWAPTPSPGRYQYHKHLTGGRASINSATGDLTLSRARLHDEYLYICAGSTLGNIRLSVHVLPKDVSILGVDGPVLAGRDINVSCVIPRVRPLMQDLTWGIAGGLSLGPPTNVVTANEDETSQVTSYLTLNFDRGRPREIVQCTVNVAKGESHTVSKPVTIHWTGESRVVEVDPSDAPTPGRTKSLRCDYTQPNPPNIISVTWTKDGQDIRFDREPRYSGQGTVQLTVQALQWTDRGSYRCHVISQAGRGASVSAYHLKVAYSECPCGWVPYLDQCYYYMDVQKTQAAAELDCRTYGGHLTSIHTQQENDHVSSLSTSASSMWIGMERTSEGWSWLDDSLTAWTMWRSDPHSADRCASLDPIDGFWRRNGNTQCDFDLKPSVCKLDMYNVDRCSESHCMFLTCKTPREASDFCDGLGLQMTSVNTSDEDLTAVLTQLNAPRGNYYLQVDGGAGYPCVTAQWNKEFTRVIQMDECYSRFFLCEFLPPPDTTTETPTPTEKIRVRLEEVKVENTHLFVRWVALKEGSRRKRDTGTGQPEVVVEYKKSSQSQYQRYPPEGGIDATQGYAVILGSFDVNSAYNVRLKLYDGEEEVPGTDQELIASKVTEKGSGVSAGILAGLAVLGALLLVSVVLLVAGYLRFVAPQRNQHSEKPKDPSREMNAVPEGGLGPTRPNHGVVNPAYTRQASDDKTNAGIDNGISMTHSSGKPITLPTVPDVSFYNEVNRGSKRSWGSQRSRSSHRRGKADVLPIANNEVRSDSPELEGDEGGIDNRGYLPSHGDYEDVDSDDEKSSVIYATPSEVSSLPTKPKPAPRLRPRVMPATLPQVDGVDNLAFSRQEPEKPRPDTCPRNHSPAPHKNEAYPRQADSVIADRPAQHINEAYDRDTDSVASERLDPYESVPPYEPPPPNDYQPMNISPTEDYNMEDNSAEPKYFVYDSGPTRV